MRRARCCIVELRREPADPWQFHESRFMVHPTPLRLASLSRIGRPPDRNLREAMELMRRQVVGDEDLAPLSQSK